METVELTLEKIKDLQVFYGAFDGHLHILESAFSVTINASGNRVIITGEAHDLRLVVKVLEHLESMVAEGYEVSREQFQDAIRNINGNTENGDFKKLILSGTVIETKKRKLYPKTPNQKRYIDSMLKNDLVFGIGPAGTGKTYLAVAMAVTSLIQKKVSRIVLARPAVEAGESLGFLPGDMYEKVNPYLRPLYDALYDMLDVDRANRLIERGVIEIAPIAFMRGRTLNDAFIIMDEAQNTTCQQMKMFLTRLGFNAHAVVTGDITQIDLKGDQISGLNHVRSILKGIHNIDFVYLEKCDIIRCRLVKDIVEAYERHPG